MAIKSREQRAESKEQRAGRKKLNLTKNDLIRSIASITSCFILLTSYCLLFTFLDGCASLQQEGRVLAVVDGDPITEGDIEYSLTVSHRREDLSSAGDLKLSDYVEKLVDDRLIVDEARRSGLDQLPEIKKAIDAFILRESVVRLHDEEIVGKVSFTDDEIKDFYRENYEQVTLGLIEVTSEEIAEEIIDQLHQGGDFEEIARTYSMHISRENGGTVVYRKGMIPTYFMEAITLLQPGEFSDTINAMNKYYIVKFFGKEEAPWGEEFDKLKGRIENAIRQQKEKERSDEYLEYLRQKANIKINKDLLAEIQLDGGTGEREKWAEDTRPLVEIDTTTRTAGDFVRIARPSTRRTKEDILKIWIDRTLVDLEALSRHYEREPQFKRMVYRYENQLLKNIFIKRVIVPQIDISEEMVKEYYENNQESFTKPDLYNIQQITLKDSDEAQVILENLQNGADFSWWAKTKSIDSSASKGGNAGWLQKSALPAPVKEIIDTLQPGDLTPILEVNSNYMIVRLKDKTVGKVKQYDEVRNNAYKARFSKQVQEIYNDYVNTLKSDSEIVIYDEEIENLEEELFH
jgi:parvulin-like peptidyl-prolyl isomerase